MVYVVTVGPGGKLGHRSGLVVPLVDETQYLSCTVVTLGTPTLIPTCSDLVPQGPDSRRTLSPCNLSILIYRVDCVWCCRKGTDVTSGVLHPGGEVTAQKTKDV